MSLEYQIKVVRGTVITLGESVIALMGFRVHSVTVRRSVKMMGFVVTRGVCAKKSLLEIGVSTRLKTTWRRLKDFLRQ